MAQARMNLVKLAAEFGSEDKCRAFLERLRWPEGVRCPECGHEKVSRVHKRRQFDCDACRRQFSVTSGTMMHDTKIPLWKWFAAVYLIIESKKGISACQMQRTLQTTYRTAWYLCHRIRKALETPDGYLKGVIEVDETYIGGKAPGRRGGFRGNKTLVIGAVQRGGEIRLKAEPKQGGTASSAKVGKFVRANIGNDAEVVYTDEHNVYPKILREHGVPHESITHKYPHTKKGWVRGEVHTNNIEGAWSLFKRSVVGSYHQLSCKHLPAYLDEFEFRFNNRENPDIFTAAMREVVEAEHLEYRELTADRVA